MEKNILLSNARATIRDIARIAEVSKATVSMVLNGSSKISPETSQRVLAISQSLNYQPNEEARRLAQRRRMVSIPPLQATPTP